MQHNLTVQYGLANATNAEQKARLCQQLVVMADILLDGYRTQLESIKWHLSRQSKDYVTEARYTEILRKYEQDRALLLSPLSMFCLMVLCYTAVLSCVYKLFALSCASVDGLF